MYKYSQKWRISFLPAGKPSLFSFLLAAPFHAFLIVEKNQIELKIRLDFNFP